MTDVVVVDSRFESEMVKRVLKYELTLSPDPVVIDIPVGATLLHVEFVQRDAQDGIRGHWLLWYEVPNTAVAGKPRVFQAMATGIGMPKCVKWCATAATRDYSYVIPQIAEVWHLYEYPSGAKVVKV